MAKLQQLASKQRSLSDSDAATTVTKRELVENIQLLRETSKRQKEEINLLCGLLLVLIAMLLCIFMLYILWMIETCFDG